MLKQALKDRKVTAQARFYQARSNLRSAAPGSPTFSLARVAVNRERTRLREITQAQETLVSQGLWKAIPKVVRALLH